MHSFYKEHDGSYAVGIPWTSGQMLGDMSTLQTDWHTLFRGLSLPLAMRVVSRLNGGDDRFDVVDMKLLDECAT